MWALVQDRGGSHVSDATVHGSMSKGPKVPSQRDLGQSAQGGRHHLARLGLHLGEVRRVPWKDSA